jgi:hypothetical protein
MDHPRPGLRYVSAGNLDDSPVNLDGLSVENQSGEKLGDVDGFVVDLQSSSVRPLYVVVDGGHWFTSRLFLLPVNTVALDREGPRLVANLSRERVSRFPGFPRDEFEQLSEDELFAADEQMLVECRPDDQVDRPVASLRDDRSKNYRHPDWWEEDYYQVELAGPAGPAMTAAREMSTSMPSREEVRARLDERLESDDLADRDDLAEREDLAERVADDVSPYLGGRAQPGDVLGIETGGEQTHIGESSRDENQRRREAEREARLEGEPGREDER